MNTGPDAYSVAKSVHWWKGSRRPQTERFSHVASSSFERRIAVVFFFSGLSRFKAVEFNLNSNWTT